MKINIQLASATVGRFITQNELLLLAKTLHGVTYDQKNGMGAIPYNQEILHRGISVLMKPSTYLSLCYPIRKGEAEAHSFERIKQSIKDGNAIGSPWLRIEINREDNTWTADGSYVSGHEGRNRALAIQELFGDVDMLVHITFNLDNNKTLTAPLREALRLGLKSQTGHFIRGPLWRA